MNACMSGVFGDIADPMAPDLSETTAPSAGAGGTSDLRSAAAFTLPAQAVGNLLRLAGPSCVSVSSLADAMTSAHPGDVATACTQLLRALDTARAMVAFDAAHRLAAVRTLEWLAAQAQACTASGQ